MNKNDQAWNQLFDKYQICQEIDAKGLFHISSKQINEFREARLMTKFDHRSNLPKIFKDNQIAILPDTRGTYILGRFEAYENLVYENLKPQKIDFPDHIESIDFSNIYSESAALNCAYVSGILANFLGEPILPTINGRMSTKAFDFNIQSIHNQPLSISVINSQCEIDGGYESPNQLMLLEAKNFISDDFLIRQLYYPFRLWQKKVSKEVVPVFMTYSNEVFSFFRFKFENLHDYNSIQLLEQKNYILTSESISLQEIIDLQKSTPILPEPAVPFPQADKLERVIDLLGLLMEQEDHTLHKDFITTNYNFDSRQTDYYSNAGIYLGLIKRAQPGVFQLTKAGIQLMKLSQKRKWLKLVECILSHEVFHKTLASYFKSLFPITPAQVVEIMKTSHVHKVSTDVTRKRRAQTVIKWIDWILDLAE